MGTDSIQTSLPDELAAELRKTRRNMADFSVASLHKCKFCTKAKTAYHLINAKFRDRVVGSWCATHGWLFFDSVALPPSERLTPSEIEERRLTEQRKQAVAQRETARNAKITSPQRGRVERNRPKKETQET